VTWLAERGVVLAFIAAYVAMLAHHAWQGRRRTEGVADYYVGGRAMGGVTIGLSFFATYSSTNSFVGFAGQGYSYGAPWLLLAPFIVGFSLLAWTVVAPRLRAFSAALGSLTIPDFLGFRFGSPTARVLSAAIVLFASFFYLTAVFKGIGNTLEAFLGVSYGLAVLLVFLIVVTYTAVGGFISVVKTDVVQGVLLILAAVLLFRGTVGAAGGLGTLFELKDAPATAPLFDWNAALPLPVLLGILFGGTIKFVVEPRQLSRFYALRDRAAVRRGLWVSTLSFALVYTLLAPIGLYARRIMPEGIADTDRIVPALLTDPAIFHPAVGGFMLVALIAAAMSSIDSVLLVMASTWQRDLLGRWRRLASERAQVRETAGWVAVFAAVTTLIALNPPAGVVKLTSFSGSLYAACFFPALLFGLYWRKGNGVAVVSSLVTGFLVLVLWTPLGIAPGIHEVFPALALSTLAHVVAAAWGRPWLAPELAEILGGGERVHSGRGDSPG
jgi:SSS family transporter